MLANLQNQIVLITGATSGIGKACAENFARAKAKLIITGRRAELLAELKPELLKLGAEAVECLVFDVSNKQQVDAALKNLPSELAEVQILINNAGLALGLESIASANSQDWDQMIDTNVKGLLYVTQAILPQMIAKNSGHIVNIGSIAGKRVYAGGSVYCASKHAVDAISRGLKRDLEGTALRVTAINPGAVETEFSKVRFKGDEQKAAAVYEKMRPLTADDIAEIILFCVSRPAHVNISDLTVLASDQPSLL